MILYVSHIGMSVPESCTEEEEKTDGGRHAIDMRQPHRPTVDVTTSGKYKYCYSDTLV